MHCAFTGLMFPKLFSSIISCFIWVPVAQPPERISSCHSLSLISNIANMIILHKPLQLYCNITINKKIVKSHVHHCYKWPAMKQKSKTSLINIQILCDHSKASCYYLIKSLHRLNPWPCLPYAQFIQLICDAMENNWFPCWNKWNSSSPLELLILGGFQYLGWGWTFVQRCIRTIFISSFQLDWTFWTVCMFLHL